MNFLLYILGRARRNSALRPVGRDAFIARAAAHAAAGRFHDALAGYRNLTETPRCSPVDLLIRGQLHLALNDNDDARDSFARGMGRLLESGGILQEQTPIERLIADAELMLNHGACDPAIKAIQQARALIDLLLSAEAGLVMAQDHIHSGAFTALVRLSDICLKMLARAELSRQLAGALRQRSLRGDLASWAASGKSVTDLLNKEYARLAKLSFRAPSHAETAYRLGLAARAAGRLKEAARAFDRVLAIHPHHMNSAVRLAATVSELSQDTDIKPTLRRALLVPPETMRLFANLSAAAADAQFDASAAIFGVASGDAATIRANLAFALSELGLLDDSRAPWRETVCA
jgi:tetratricopeptide (TPR) repeat protein